MKKILLFIICVLAIGAFAFTGCKQKDGQSNSDTTNDIVTEENEPTPSEEPETPEITFRKPKIKRKPVNPHPLPHPVPKPIKPR